MKILRPATAAAALGTILLLGACSAGHPALPAPAPYTVPSVPATGSPSSSPKDPASNPAPPRRATVKAAGASSGAPTRSATVAEGQHRSAAPVPTSITAVVVCRVFTGMEWFNKSSFASIRVSFSLRRDLGHPRSDQNVSLLLLARLIPGSGDCCSNDLAVRGGQLLRAEFEGQLVELAREAERHLVVLVVYSGAGVHADIEGLVSR